MPSYNIDMPSFYVWETKDWELKLTNENDDDGILDNLKDVIISFGQNSTLLEKDMSHPDVAVDSANNIINVHMSQEDTGRFKTGSVTVQVNLLYTDTERDTTVQGTIMALANLHREVMR